MPDKIVQVDGVGQVSFPDSMGDEDIANVIRQQHPNLGKPSAPQGSFIGNALGTAASDIAGIPSGIKAMATHPIETFKAGTAAPPRPQVPESQLKQGIIPRIQRALGGGENFNPPGANMPVSEALGHGIAGAGLSLLPGAIKVAPEAGAALMERAPQGFNITPRIASGVAAAAPKVAGGTAMIGTGAALGGVMPGGPLVQWPIRAGFIWPGTSMIRSGLKAGAQAMGRTGEQAVSELPTIKAPAAVKPPAVFGDPEGFSKLPQSVQDAIMRGTQSQAPSKSTPMEPRGPEHYGIASPVTVSPGSIPVPKSTVEGAVTKLDMPEHEPYNSYSESRVERQLTPAKGNPEQDAQVERLRKAFPWETDQQLRARAGHAGVMGKLASKPGAMENMKKLKQSLGGD